MVIPSNAVAQPTVQAAPAPERALPPSPMNESVDKTLGKRPPADLTLGGQPVPPGGQVNGLPDKANLEHVVAALNDYVQSLQRDLEFSVDSETGRTVVKVLDHQSRDVIRQIPAEEVLAVAHHIASLMEEGKDGLLLRLSV